MSSYLFPAFQPGQANWKYPYKKTPEFASDKQMPASGRGELSIPLRQYPLWKFNIDISYFLGSPSVPSSWWLAFVGFYMAVQGAGDDWLFLDPEDNTVNQQTIGVGDGLTTVFPLYRTFSGYGGQDLIQNFSAPPRIYVAGTLQSSGAYSIDAFGNLTFNVAPASPKVISWSTAASGGVFYYRCRFEEDSLGDMQEDFHNIWSCHELKFRSVLL